MTRVRAVLFDLDGTLVDNMPFHIDAWIAAGRALGKTVTAEQVMRDFAGRRNEEILPQLLGRPLRDGELERLAGEKEAMYRALYAAHVRPLEGTLALLDELARSGVTVAIASAAPRANREFVLAQLGFADRFAAIVGGEEVTRGKPHPDLFLAAAARIGAAPDSTLVFEDARLGVTAARAAGMRAVGITTVEPAEVLAGAGALATAPDFAHLPESVRATWLP